MKYSLKRLVLIVIILLITAVSLIICFSKSDEESEKDKPIVELAEKEIMDKLPMTVQVGKEDTKPETIAYRIWFDLMQELKNEGKVANAYFERFHLLEEAENEFVVAVVFQLQLQEGVETNLGEEKEEGLVEHLVWKLKITKGEEQAYTLENFEKSTDRYLGLPEVQDTESYQKEAGIKKLNEGYRYEIINATLKITFDNGENWIEVPVTTDDLFGGDYSGSKDYLMEGSFIINPNKTVFLLFNNHELNLLMSTDQGKTWDKVLIKDQLPSVRQRFLGFTSDKDGYLIFTGDRTMSSEANFIAKTNDGGKSWEMVGSVNEVFALVTDGNFINKYLGFISFGSLNTPDEPPTPRLYRTTDGGSHWEEVEVPIPEEYKGIFIVAEVPFFNEGHGTLIVNQGPNGDYLGGKVLAKFVSEDEGKTWTFDSLVDPDNVLGE